MRLKSFYKYEIIMALCKTMRFSLKIFTQNEYKYEIHPYSGWNFRQVHTSPSMYKLHTHFSYLVL